MNPFMVWSQKERGRISREWPGDTHSYKPTELHNAEISRLLGTKWRGLTEEQRRPFVDQSNWLRMQHARNFPDYKYQPKRRKPKKKKTKFSTASEAPPPT